MKNLQKIYLVVTSISIIIFTIFLSYCFLITVVPIDIITYKNIRQKVLNHNLEVKKGQQVNIEIDRCKNLPYSAIKVETFIVNEVTWQINIPYQPYSTGCEKSRIDITIPQVIPSGETVRISRTLTYQVSPFTQVQETWTSMDFKVL